MKKYLLLCLLSCSFVFAQDYSTIKLKAMTFARLAEAQGLSETQAIIAVIYSKEGKNELALEWAQKACQNEIEGACNFYQILSK